MTVDFYMRSGHVFSANLSEEVYDSVVKALEENMRGHGPELLTVVTLGDMLKGELVLRVSDIEAITKPYNPLEITEDKEASE